MSSGLVLDKFFYKRNVTIYTGYVTNYIRVITLERSQHNWSPRGLILWPKAPLYFSCLIREMVEVINGGCITISKAQMTIMHSTRIVNKKKKNDEK